MNVIEGLLHGLSLAWPRSASGVRQALAVVLENVRPNVV